jgi:hypothetical protein
MPEAWLGCTLVALVLVYDQQGFFFRFICVLAFR